MKKKNLLWNSLLLGVALLPATLQAQDYNNIHRFPSNYERSAHTCATQLRNDLIAEGGTLSNPAINDTKVVEIGLASAVSGTLVPHPYVYGLPSIEHTAADLIESLGDPNQVICAANMRSPEEANTSVNIFKTDPATGNVSWSVRFKSSFGFQTANAITRDREKNYYILGQGQNSIRRYFYLIKIDDSGSPVWERYYFLGTRSIQLDGIDLIYDGDAVIIAGNSINTATDPGDQGVIIAKIDPASGAVLNARHVSHLNGNPNIKVRDLSYINGNYVMVGEYNPNIISPLPALQYGFMVSFNTLLDINVARIYGDPQEYNLRLTGVEQGVLGDMYMTFDRGTNARASFLPGIIQADASGAVLNSEIYKLGNYHGTNGLIGVYGLRAYMIKGDIGIATSPTPPGAPSLSMIGQSIPLAGSEEFCSGLYEIKYREIGYRNLELNLLETSVNTAERIELRVAEVKGRTYNCHNDGIAEFRAARPALEEEKAATAFDIFPNPSNGQFSLNFEEGSAPLYQTGEVYNMTGTLVHTFNINNLTTVIDLSLQGTGIYLLRLKTADGQVSDAKRMVIE